MSDCIVCNEPLGDELPHAYHAKGCPARRDGSQCADLAYCGEDVHPGCCPICQDGELEASPRPGYRGLYGMICWNGLSAEQQERLVRVGVLEYGYERRLGECPNDAQVGLETIHDPAPGPRFMCGPCAIAYLNDLFGVHE